MLLGVDFMALVAVLLFGSALAYRISFLHNKKIAHISLLQILYLVVIPGFLFVLGYDYMQAILLRPRAEMVFLADGLLINLILLSFLYAYAGIAIHAVTKMLSEELRHEKSKASEINKYFHLSFSHNLFFGGVFLIILGFALLELNRVPLGGESLFSAVIKGLVLGLSFILGMWLYVPYDYGSRWASLKGLFLVFWVGMVLLLYGIRRLDPTWRQYDLLIPVMLSFSMVALLNAVLAIRRLRRGGIRLYFKWWRLFALK